MSRLPDDLFPAPLVPRRGVERPTPLAAQKYLEQYRVLAMAMATRAIAGHWDSGLLAHRADATFVALAGEAAGTEPDEPDSSVSFPLEQEVLALIGVSRGRAPERVLEAERGVRKALEDLTAGQAAAAGPMPLDELADEFQLGAMAKLMLVLIAAPQLWGAVHQLYRMAVNDPARPGVDEHLLSLLFGPQVNPHAIAHELRGAAPLIAGGLVRRDDGASAMSQLRVSPLMLARLRGDLLLEDPEHRDATWREPQPLSAIILGEDAVAALLEWAERDPIGAPLVLRGRKASGRTTTLRALAAAANRRLELIDLGRLVQRDRQSVVAALAFALERCHLAGWIPCVTGFDALSEERELRGALGHLLDTHPGPLTLRLGPDEQPLISPGYRLVDLAPLSETQRQELWRTELVRHALPAGEHTAFASRWRVGPGTIRHVVATVAASPEGTDLAAAVDRMTSQHLQSRLGDVAERVHELADLSDLVLPPDILDSLTEFIARNRLGQKVYEEWGMGRVAPTGRGLTALFQGAPGTGKTMVAGALARELGRDLYRVDLSRVLSKWMGETERNLASVFAAAEDGHAIILFDEADSLFTKRTEVKSSNDRHANVEVNYLLQRLDSFIGIAILTTNFGTAIDPAFKRRLSFRLTFPVPDEELREQLWRKLLPPSLPTGPLDLSDLARKYHLAGGAVRNCVMRAAFLAAAEDQILTQDHLLRAIRLEYRSVGKLSEGGPLE